MGGQQKGHGDENDQKAIAFRSALRLQGDDCERAERKGVSRQQHERGSDSGSGFHDFQ